MKYLIGLCVLLTALLIFYILRISILLKHSQNELHREYWIKASFAIETGKYDLVVEGKKASIQVESNNSRNPHFLAERDLKITNGALGLISGKGIVRIFHSDGNLVNCQNKPIMI